jgi:hypothetical protein
MYHHHSSKQFPNHGLKAMHGKIEVLKIVESTSSTKRSSAGARCSACLLQMLDLKSVGWITLRISMDRTVVLRQTHLRIIWSSAHRRERMTYLLGMPYMNDVCSRVLKYFVTPAKALRISESYGRSPYDGESVNVFDGKRALTCTQYLRSASRNGYRAELV